MAHHAQNPKPNTALDAATGDMSMIETSEVAKVKKTKTREATACGFKSYQKSAKLLAAEKVKADRRLAREIKQNESDDRFTSQELVDAFEASFGKIDCDPCWHKSSKVRPSKYLDVREGHNGLRDEWSGPVAFVNPPWSAQDAWLRHAHKVWLTGKVKTILCLVPAAVNAPFFHRTLARDADVYFLERRQRFYKEDGSSQSSMHHVMVVMFGTTHQQRMRFADLVEGSWWFPSRTPKLRSEDAQISQLGMLMKSTSTSCAAGNYIYTVSCRPLVDSTSPNCN
jgi:hypothetical protein